MNPQSYRSILPYVALSLTSFSALSTAQDNQKSAIKAAEKNKLLIRSTSILDLIKINFNFLSGFLLAGFDKITGVDAVLVDDELIVIGNIGCTFTQIYIAYLNINTGALIDSLLWNTSRSARAHSIYARGCSNAYCIDSATLNGQLL